MSITYIVIFGLLLLTVSFACLKYPKIASVFLIPLVYFFYYVFVSIIPEQYGYPIDHKYVKVEEALLVTSYEVKQKLYLVILEDGKINPRVVEVPNTKENKEEAEKAKKGANRVKFGGSNKTGKTSEGGDSDFGVVPMDLQTLAPKSD